MKTVENFSNGNKTAKVLRVEKNGKVRFLAASGNQLLVNTAFVRKYPAVNICRQYLHSEPVERRPLFTVV